MRFTLGITEIAAEATAAIARLAEATEGERPDRGPGPYPPAGPVGVTPAAEGLMVELAGLLERLRSLEPSLTAAAPATVGADKALGRLGNQGIGQLSALAQQAHRSGLPEEAATFGRLSLSLACWIARHGGEITNLAPLVDNAAALANALRDPRGLEGLFLLLGEIQHAVPPAISQELDRTDPRRPWRLLLVNRAIVATRTHQPRLMEEAFHALTEQLPEDAPAFFREGMEQMHLLDYPEPVRRVMQRYHDAWRAQTLLH